MSKEAYYFSHDANARNDPKVLAMICDYTFMGYAWFWVVVENLREQTDYKLKHDRSTWKSLSMQLHSGTDDIKKFLGDCIYEYALFEISEDMYFYSNSLMSRMQRYSEIKEKKKEAANKRWSNADAMQMQCKDDADAMQMQCKDDADAMQKHANEIKLNKTKENIYTCEFEKFYSLYPNPFDKQQTLKNFNATLKHDTYENILQATNNYISFLEKNNNSDKKYITRSTNFVGKAQTYKGYLETETSKEMTPERKRYLEIKAELEKQNGFTSLQGSAW